MKFYFLVFFYENPNPDPTFFVYWKLLISLLNGAFFRLGDNFSVRPYGARFSATDFQQLFKRMVGTPYGFCCAAGLGKIQTTANSWKRGGPVPFPDVHFHFNFDLSLSVWMSDCLSRFLSLNVWRARRGENFGVGSWVVYQKTSRFHCWWALQKTQW